MMLVRIRLRRQVSLAVVALSSLGACSSSPEGGDRDGAGGAIAEGGNRSGGGDATDATGGTTSAGGSVATAGRATSSGGGASGRGGRSSAGDGNGGAASGRAGTTAGGTMNGGTGAGATAGGANGGGTTAGGAMNGGAGTTAGGAMNGGAGTTAGGAMNGGTAGGGATGSGGASGTGGAGGATACKRGIAANTAPGARFFPSITWWYNWAIKPSGADVGIEFVPMVWGKSTVNADLPSGSKFLLTFNEPNFHSQSNLTAAQAASYWPTLEAKAKAAHIPLVSPAMNFCGPASDCNGTSPYQYLKDFFAACPGCEVDYVAVHWYNCDLPSLKDYLEPGGNLEGFEQFAKPIWLTEFSCNGSASAADQEAFMRKAIPYLETNSHVYRYSWFSAGPIPNAKLINDDGTPTALGNVYIGLDQSCR
jgi:hypothetical protein